MNRHDKITSSRAGLVCMHANQNLFVTLHVQSSRRDAHYINEVAQVAQQDFQNKIN